MRSQLAAIICICSLFSSVSWGQYQLEMDPFQSSFYAQKIDTLQIKEHLSYLSSEELAGRETGTPGLKLAGDYIIEQLKKSGVTPVNNQYEQAISMAKTYWNTIRLSVDNEEFTHLQDFIALPQWNKNQPNVDIDQILFMGYGIESEEYNDYARTKVHGKTIMILGGEPMDSDGISRLTKAKKKVNGLKIGKRNLRSPQSMVQNLLSWSIPIFSRPLHYIEIQYSTLKLISPQAKMGQRTFLTMCSSHHLSQKRLLAIK